MAPIKVYVTVHESLKNRYLKKVLYHKLDTFLANLEPRSVMKTNGLGIEVGLQLTNFIISLCATYIRHSRGNC